MILRALRSLSLAAALLPLAAFGQAADTGAGVNIDLGGAGAGVHVDIHDHDDTGAASVKVRGSTHQEIKVNRPGQHYRLTYDGDRHGRTLFKVLAPEGFRIRVTDGFTAVVQDSIPVSFTARDGHFYRIEIFGPDGKVFDKKLEAREGRVARLWVLPPTSAQVSVTVGTTAPPPGPAPSAAPPPPAPPSGCMSDADLASLKQALGAEDFSEGKLTVIGDFATGHAFCVSQVVSVLGTLDFSETKLKALQAMKPQITDPQNDFRIYQAFDFSGDKAKARQILSH